MGLLKCAPDDRGQEDHCGGQQQSANNPASQSNGASSNWLTRLTARIEFGGPQFSTTCLDDEHRQNTASTPAAGSRKSRGSVGYALGMSRLLQSNCKRLINIPRTLAGGGEVARPYPTRSLTRMSSFTAAPSTPASATRASALCRTSAFGQFVSPSVMRSALSF
jgi:hypothetical protein